MGKLTVGGLYSKAEDYLMDNLGKIDENYYLKNGEQGKFQGELTKELGLSAFDSNSFKLLYSGCSPDGKQLIQYGNSGEYDGDHQQGYDLTFSLAKDLSMKWALSKDTKVSQAIMDAHHAAMNIALKYFEQNFIEVTIDHGNTGLWIDGSGNKGGLEYVNTGKMISAQFDHYTTRPNPVNPKDPDSEMTVDLQVHSHNPIFNMTQIKYVDTIDEEVTAWKTINRTAFKKFQAFGEKIYNNELVRELNQRGIEAYIDEEGFTHSVDRNPIEIEEVFSNRTMIAKQNMIENGLDPNDKNALRYAIKETRQEKEFHDIEELKAEWKERYQALGLTKDIEFQLVMPKEFQPRMSAQKFINKAIEKVSANNFLFTEQMVLKQAFAISNGEYSFKEIIKAFDKSPELASKTFHPKHDTFKTQLIYTTNALMNNEIENLKIIGEHQNTMKPLYSKGQVEKMIKKHDKENPGKHYDPSQKFVLRSTLSSNHGGIQLLQALPGSGKSTLATGVKEAYEAKGYHVYGVAPTNKARNVLARKGLEAYTVDAFLKMKRTDRPYLVIFDEATMISTKKFAAIMCLKTKDNVFIIQGDERQLSSVGSGHEFVNYIHHYEHHKLTVLHRQKTEELKTLVILATEKKVDLYIKHQEENNMITYQPEGIKKKEGYKWLGEEIVKEFVNSKGKAEYIITPTNKAMRELNPKVREALIKDGCVEKGYKVTVNLDKKLSPTGLDLIKNYSVGDYINPMGKIGTLIAGEQARIIEKNLKEYSLTVQSLITGKTSNIDILNDSDKYTVSEDKTIEIGRGDKVVATETNKELGIANNELLVVKDFDGNNITFEKEDNIEVKTQLSIFKSFETAFAGTIHKAEGSNMNVIVDAREPLKMTAKMNYTAGSRPEDYFKVFTTNKEEYREGLIAKETGRLTALDYMTDKEVKAAIKNVKNENKSLDKEIAVFEKEQRIGQKKAEIHKIHLDNHEVQDDAKNQERQQNQNDFGVER